MSDKNSLDRGDAIIPPRVSIVVPVYNGAPYLAECLASIVAQTYQRWEAVVVNNCSTDSTAEIADAFARQDSRFRVVHCQEFVPKSENYNRAIASASEGVEFIKLLEADNYLWPESIERMVDLASTDPEIGLVGSYYVYGNKIIGDVIEGKRTVLAGNEVRRDHLLTDAYYFAVPTAMLFRAKALSELTPCFRPELFFDDIELYFRVLSKWKYGFVHQVLAFVRHDNDGVFTRTRDFDFFPAHRFALAMQFGKDVLGPEELSRARELWRRVYLRRLGRAAVAGRSKQYWDLHKSVFRFIGRELKATDLIGPVTCTLVDMLLNPKSTVEGLFRRQHRLQQCADSPHKQRTSAMDPGPGIVAATGRRSRLSGAQ
jgi:glycosyltransferase involved in cell wall biosynthesis